MKHCLKHKSQKSKYMQILVLSIRVPKMNKITKTSRNEKFSRSRSTLKAEKRKTIAPFGLVVYARVLYVSTAWTEVTFIPTVSNRTSGSTFPILCVNFIPAL